MKAQVSFTVDIFFLDGKPEAIKPQRVEEAVAEAMTNAVRFAEGEGHIHTLANRLAILLDGKVSAKLFNINIQ